MSSNVDTCVRILENCMLDTDDVSMHDFSLSDSNRVSILRGLTHSEILAKIISMKQQLHTALTSIFEKSYELHKSSNDNKTDADLYLIHNNTKYDIELKFGHKTDRNIGMRSFITLLNFDLFKKCLSSQQRKSWQELVMQEYSVYGDEAFQRQEERLHSSLQDVSKKFNEEFSNTILSKESTDYFLHKILNMSGSPTNSNQKRLIFTYVNNSFTQIPTIINDGHWKILPIEADKNKRVTIKLINTTINKKVSFILNWKNNFTIKACNLKVPSKCGLSSPSWNVFVTDI